MKTRTFLFLFLFLVPMLHLLAQSTNVDCGSAFEISDPSNYCSGDTEFNSDDVGSSGIEDPLCWENGVNNDLWFTFVAPQTSINITVDGTFQEDNLEDIRIAIYKGEDCSSLSNTGACVEDGLGQHYNQLFFSDLKIGQRYFILIDSRRNAGDGIFKICTSTFDAPVTPGKDCVDAAILCSKDPFVVEYVDGEGLDDEEADGACLFVGEENSSWFKFECGVAGTLTFSITPVKDYDDYDFAIFELPNGLETCDTIHLRCVASNGGFVPMTDTPTDCGQVTGLDETSVDFTEDLGCEDEEDGFARFIDMEVGKSYVLIVNNFSDTDSGFSIEFGGTGEFASPEPEIEVIIDPSEPCGQNLIVSANNLDNIDSVHWDFGIGSDPLESDDIGPHSISYSEEGIKNITLKAFSEEGCQVLVTESIVLDECSYLKLLSLDIQNQQDIECGEMGTGSIELEPSISCFDYTYTVNGVDFSEPTFGNLSEGEVAVRLTDENGCTLDTVYTILLTADFTVSAGDDVTIEDPAVGIQLDAMTTAATDVTVSWSPSTGVTCPDGSTNCLNPQIDVTEETTFTITVTDENGCVATDEITVSVNLCGASLIALSIDSLRSSTCEGDSTGFIQVSGVDGEPGYLFSINEGEFTEDSTFDSLPAGDYIVTVQDMNGCTAGLVVMVNEVPDFTMDAGPDITLDLPGDIANPSIETSLSSGFTVQWSPAAGITCTDGTTNCLNPSIEVSETTTFTITITDDGGCVRSDMLTVIVPDVCANSDLAITIDSLSGEYCNGAQSSYLGVSGVSGFPDYLYNVDGGAFDSDSIFTNLAPGTYTIGIQDRFACITTIDVTIEDEAPFTVSAGSDVETNGTEPFPSLSGSHSSSDDVSISWSPASGIICPDSTTLNCLNPLVNPSATTTYTMTITDSRGCVVTDEVTVRVVRNEEVYGPNIFTPNEDGVHDFFTLQADPDIVESIENLSIFDRWGNKVYEGRNLSPADPNSGWNGLVNGQAAEQGVYVWFATIKFVVSSQEPGAESDTKIVKGDVALIR